MMEQVMAYLQTPWLQQWVPWAIFGGYLIVTWLVVWLARWLLRGMLGRMGARRGSLLAERLMRTAVGPLRFLIWTTGLYAALQALGNRVPIFSEAALLGGEFGVLVRIVGSLMILAVAALITAVLKAAMDLYVQERGEANGAAWNELLPAGRRVFSLLVYFIAASIILRSQFNQDITALVTTAGVASLAIALAAQETLSNMLGGFVILVDRPFKVGDAIELTDGKGGEVAEIGLRSTRITQYDGTALVVPNKDMANSRVINMAQPAAHAAIRQTIGVGYGTDIERAKQLLLEVIQAHPEVLHEPAPGVWFTKFNAISLELFMSAWVASYKDRFRVADELNVRILKAFREAGIDIPHSQPVVLARPADK
jgi:small-conductance mechanosensitive channel